jgi:hypothetical protein
MFDPARCEAQFPGAPVPLEPFAPPGRLAAGKYFRLARLAGVWWLVRPEGQPFFSLGIDPAPFPARRRGVASTSPHRAGWAAIPLPGGTI